MIELSRNNKALLQSFNKGYRVDKDGLLISPRELVLKQKLNNKGYKYFGVKYLGKVVQVMIHRLQAYQKYGDAMFKSGIVCRHLNNIATDNSIDNIAIGTQSENMMDLPKEVRVRLASNPKHNHLEMLKDYYENGLSYGGLMDKYDIKSKGTISNIVTKSLAYQKYIEDKSNRLTL